MSEPQTTPNAVQEAVLWAQTQCGPLTQREEYVAREAARGAVKWTNRILAEELQERANAYRN